MKALVIIANPKAGAGRALESVRVARREIWGRHCEYFLPRTREELARACASLSPERHAAIVVIGGDGTTNLVIRELQRAGLDIPLYAFPGGTANDLAHELGIEADWGMVERALLAGHQRRLDLLEVNGTPFITIAGIGLGAILTQELNEARERSPWVRLAMRKLKRETYSLLALKTIIRDGASSLRVRIEAGAYRKIDRIAALFVCNQRNLGGNLRVAERSNNSDGRFHVLIIEKASRASLVSDLAQLHQGIIPNHLISLSTDRLVVESVDDQALQVFGDGETLVESTRLEFSVARTKLRVLVPEEVA